MHPQLIQFLERMANHIINFNDPGIEMLDILIRNEVSPTSVGQILESKIRKKLAESVTRMFDTEQQARIEQSFLAEDTNKSYFVRESKCGKWVVLEI